jgi:hypothetical protein
MAGPRQIQPLTHNGSQGKGNPNRLGGRQDQREVLVPEVDCEAWADISDRDFARPVDLS